MDIYKKRNSLLEIVHYNIYLLRDRGEVQYVITSGG